MAAGAAAARLAPRVRLAAPAGRRRGSRKLSTFHHLRPEEPGSRLDLEEIDTNLFRAFTKDLWVPPGGRSVFGGQVLGQALHAAQRTVPGALGPHGMF